MRQFILCGLTMLLAAAVHADVIVNNNGGATGTGFYTQSEASVLTIGSTVIVAYDDSGSFAGNTNKFVGYARSTDGGITFTDMGTLPTNPGGDAGDARLARNTTTGTVFMSTIPFAGGGYQVFRSLDSGVTFSAPVNGAPGVTGGDTASIAVDNFAGAGNGTVYLAVRDFGATPGTKLFRSTDDGLTFSGGQIIAGNGSQAPHIAIAPDHSVTIAYIQNGVSNTLVTRRSTDGGLSFGVPVTAATLVSNGVNGDLGLTGIRQGTVTPSGFRTNGFPHLVANPVSGHLYMVYADKGAGSDKGNIYLVMSTNGGATWSAPTRINSDAGTNDQWNPTIAVSPDGKTLGIFWYDRRDDAGNNFINYYGRQCGINGGTLTCTADFMLSDQAFLPEFGRDAVVNSVYMGDFDTASADNTFFYVGWGSNFLDLAGGGGRKDPNVFFDRVLIDSVTTAVPEPGAIWLVALGLLALRRRFVHG